MNNFANTIREMLAFGFTQAQIEEILVNHQDEIQTQVFSDFIDKNEDSKIEEIKNKLTQAQSAEAKANVFEEITVLAYGSEAQSKREEIMSHVLVAALDLAKEIRSLYQKYQAGDPEAVAKVQAAMQSPDYATLSGIAKSLDTQK